MYLYVNSIITPLECSARVTVCYTNVLVLYFLDICVSYISKKNICRLVTLYKYMYGFIYMYRKCRWNLF